MYRMHAVHRKKRPTLYSLLLFSCLLLLNGCSLFPSNSTSATSGNGSSVVSIKPTPTLTAAQLALQQEQTKAKGLLSKMSLDDKLAQMIMVEFVGSDYAASGLQTMIAQQHVGGVLYQPINNNFQPPNDTIDGAHTLSQQMMTDDTTAPLIAIDQEGGLVSKINGFFGESPSAEQLAQTGDPQQAYNQAMTDAANLKQLGINVDLAPVVDVGPDSNVLVSRMFSTNPQTVATYAGNFVNGLQQHGIIGTLKHFPGLGTVPQGYDPHATLPQVTSSMTSLQNSDFVPYKTIIKQDDPAMVMDTDVVTQALDPNTAAELSPKVISYLRNTLDFQGVLITDGLYMGGLYNGSDPTAAQLTQVSVQAIEAGNDIIEGPSTPDEITNIIAGLNTAIQQGNLPQSQIDQSVTRILMMKLKYGIIK